MNDGINLSGNISWSLIGKNGDILNKGEIKNVITNYGKEWVAGILGGATTSVWLGAGTSIGPSAVVSANDSSLFQEISSNGYGYSRSITTKTVANNTIQYSAYISNITNPITIREVGLLSSSSIGSTYLIAHQLIGQIPMGPTYTALQVSWTISLN